MFPFFRGGPDEHKLLMKNFTLFSLLLCSSLLAAQYSPFSPLRQPAERPDLPEFAERATHFEVAAPDDVGAYLADMPMDDEPDAAGVLLEVPAPDGEAVTFRLFRYRMLNPELQKRYPEFATLYGWDVNNPGRRIHAEWTSLGFGATVTGGQEGRWLVTPTVRNDRAYYQVYRAADFPRRHAGELVCDLDVTEDYRAEMLGTAPSARVGDCQLRDYDLALACSANYFNRIAGITTDDVPTEEDTQTVIAEMITAINRVNQITRQDLALTFTIINLPTANDGVQLVYGGDTLADPYSDFSGSLMIDENQENIDAVIGSAGYDIGHVFSTGGGGLASLGSPCNSSIKARGVTGLPNPTGDPFYVDFVAHEMGHQFGGTHTFNSTRGSCSEREAATAYEPGGGTTIQAYAGICGPVANIQLNSDAYYHAASIQQIAAYMEQGGGATCATVASTANAEPAVDAGQDYTIPANTPFVLDGSGSTDADAGDLLTYCWEQFDLGDTIPGIPPGALTTGPLFRSRPPVVDPERYFPNLPGLTAGGVVEWETLPTVARSMNFILTVRDLGAAGYGCAAQDQMTVTVADSPGFAVAAPNGGEVYLGGSVQTITWEVGGSGPGTAVNCPEVTVMLSTDGGLTYPEALGTVPNTGSADVAYPEVTQTDARIMLRCSDNIFFDISDADFRLEQTDFSFETGNGAAAACAGGDVSGGYDFQLESLQGYEGTVTYSVAGLPAGATATFEPASVDLTAGDSVSVAFTVSGLSGAAEGASLFQVIATDGINPREGTFSLEIKPPLEAPLLLSPPDGGNISPGAASFDWTDVPNATEYRLQVFTGPDGTGSAFSNEGVLTQSAINFGGQLDGAFTDGQEGSWRVTVVDADCEPEATVQSEVSNFTWGASSTASLSAPFTEQNVCEGSELSRPFVITFTDGDLTGPATLSVTDVPMGVTGELSATSLTDGQTTRLTVSGEEALTVGNYTISVEATDGSATEAIEFTLSVAADEVPLIMPTQEQLIEIVNGDAEIPLSFDQIPGVSQYTVTIIFPGGGELSQPLSSNNTVLGLGPTTAGSRYTIFLSTDTGLEGCPITVTMVDELLPVSWLTFRATATDKAVDLDWSVEQDDGHRGFNLERSTNGSDWADIGWVERQGGNGTAAYLFQDVELPGSGTYLYRLRQEDFDGSTDYSTIATVNFITDGQRVRVYPNPVSGRLFIREYAGASLGTARESMDDRGLNYRLTDQLGRTVRSGKLVGGTADLDLAKLPSAIYLLALRNERGFRQLSRVVKR